MICFVVFIVGFVIFGSFVRQPKAVASQQLTSLVPESEKELISKTCSAQIAIKIELVKESSGPCLNGACGIGYSSNCVDGSFRTVNNNVTYSSGGCGTSGLRGNFGARWYPGKIINRVFRR